MKCNKNENNNKIYVIRQSDDGKLFNEKKYRNKAYLKLMKTIRGSKIVREGGLKIKKYLEKLNLNIKSNNLLLFFWIVFMFLRYWETKIIEIY